MKVISERSGREAEKSAPAVFGTSPCGRAERVSDALNRHDIPLRLTQLLELIGPLERVVLRCPEAPSSHQEPNPHAVTLQLDDEHRARIVDRNRVIVKTLQN